MKVLKMVLVFILILSLLPAFAGQEAKKKDKPTVFESWASYIKDARYSDFPPEVVKMAKLLVLDNVGCALGAIQTEEGKKYVKLAKILGGNPEASVMAGGIKISPLNAAYINGQMANILDFDDTYDLYLPGHPGNGIVQTAIALGESLGATGEEFLTAVILGYEICLRAGKAAGPLDWEYPFLSSVMDLGTATVAARLLKLDEKTIVESLRHNDAFPLPLHRERFDLSADLEVTDIKNNAGLHAMKGILAARRAQLGLKGMPNFLDGGLRAWFMAGGKVESHQILTAGLSKDYLIMEVSFKPTPSCRLSHAPVTALWQALGNKGVKNEEIEKIEIKWVKRLDRPNWEKMLQAQFSIQCVLAMAALGIETGPQWYVTGRFNDKDVKDLAAKVVLKNDPEAEVLEFKENKTRCTVKVTFKDGKIKEATINQIKGAPGNPMSEDELKAKFHRNTRDIMKATRIKKIIGHIIEIEKLKNLSHLTDLLRNEGP